MKTRKNRNLMLTFVALIALGSSGCGSQGPLHQLSSEVSDCGGFARLGSPLMEEAPAYCDAEVLHWQYDAQAGVLSVNNTRVELNCCGVHGVGIAEQGGVYVITETDEPEFGDARCGCMCVFDFSLSAEGIPAGTIQVKLVREVSDWPEGSGVVFEGELDLSAGAGFVVLDDADTMWCEDPEESQVRQVQSEISACGGFGVAPAPLLAEPPAYCDAEVLHWAFDAETGGLTLSNTRVELNCCGEHGITIAEEGGTVVVVETDDPLAEGGRCSCMCVFDFQVTASGVAAGILPLRLERVVSNEGEAAGALVFDGTLDLGAGAGFVVISDQPSMWCEQP